MFGRRDRFDEVHARLDAIEEKIADLDAFHGERWAGHAGRIEAISAKLAEADRPGSPDYRQAIIAASQADPDFAGGMEAALANLKALLERQDAASRRNAEAWARFQANLAELEAKPGVLGLSHAVEDRQHGLGHVPVHPEPPPLSPAEAEIIEGLTEFRDSLRGPAAPHHKNHPEPPPGYRQD